MEKKLLLYRQSHRHDVFVTPIIAFLSVFMIYIFADYYEGWIVLKSFLKYGFSGDGWWFVFVCVFLAVTFLIFYGVSKLSQVDKDEFLYLEGDELIYIHGKTKKRVKVKDVYEIHVFIKPMSYVRLIKFKTKNPRDLIDFGGDYSLSFRIWIDSIDLFQKGIEIYQLLKEINPNIELTRFVPRKYRSTKNAVVERYEGGKWVPEEIRPWWEK